MSLYTAQSSCRRCMDPSRPACHLDSGAHSRASTEPTEHGAVGTAEIRQEPTERCDGRRRLRYEREEGNWMQHRRVIVSRHGGPEVLKVVEADRPEPKAGDGRCRCVELRAGGIAPG